MRYGQAETGELYDYAEDPHECRNRFDDPAYQQIQRDLFSALAHAYLTRRPDTPYRGGW